jgi:hypothetical protein
MPELPSPISEHHARARHVRGPGVPLLRATWRATLPEEAWQALRSEVDAPTRAFLDAPPDVDTWVSLEVLAQAAEAYRRAASMGLSRIQGSLTADEFADHAHTEYTSPEALLDAMPSIWRHYYDGGVAQVTQRGAGTAEISIWVILPYAPWLSELFPAWFRQSLEACGCTGVEVHYVPPEPGGYRHRYQLRWA